MNILLLTTHLNTGGITSYLMTLTKGFVSRGQKVFIGSSSGDRAEDFKKLSAQVVDLNIRTKSELSPKIYFALQPLKRLITSQSIDIIHSQTRVTQVLGQMLKGATEKQYVSTCHGFFKRRFSRLLCPCWGDRVIAISQAVAGHLQNDFHVSIDKIALIESGIDLESFLPVSEEIRTAKRKEFGLGDGPVIGMIARLSDVKGQDILVKAMPELIRQIPDVKLLLVGIGRMEGELKGLAQSLGLQNQVMFYPVVNQTPDILPLLDIFVVPSRQEGLGLSVMEAQAVGLPVVASRVGGIPSLITDGETGFLVEPENVQALSETLIRVLKSPEDSKQVGIKARDFIRKNHSSDRMVTQTLELYRRIINSKPEFRNSKQI